MSALPSFPGFADEFRTPGQAVIEPALFAAAMNLQVQELAQLAHVHRATVSEAPTNARLQGFMREALQVLSAAFDVTRDRERAIYWYRNSPIREFQHRTAEQLVADRKTDAVLSYLASIGSGATGSQFVSGIQGYHPETLNELCRRYSVRRLAAFGSATRTDFDPARSDVDLVVEFSSVPNGSSARQYFDFKSALERLFGRPVDLVELDAMPDSRLRRRIERSQVPLYAEAA